MEKQHRRGSSGKVPGALTSGGRGGTPGQDPRQFKFAIICKKCDEIRVPAGSPKPLPQLPFWEVSGRDVWTLRNAHIAVVSDVCSPQPARHAKASCMPARISHDATATGGISANYCVHTAPGVTSGDDDVESS